MNKKFLLFVLASGVLVLNSSVSFGEEPTATLYSDSSAIVTESGATSPVYSSDSKHFAYSVVKKDKTVIVVDGKELPTKYDEIDTSFFGVLDDKSVYVKAKVKATNKWFYVIGSTKSDMYDEINIYLYGDKYDIASGSARRGDKWYVIHNNKIVGPYEYVDAFPSYIDTTKFFFKVTKNKKSTLVINGKQVKLGYDLENFWLSPDGKKVALVVIDTDGQKFVMLGNKKFKKYTDIYSITFSSDSKELMYVGVGKDSKQTVVVDGNDVKTYETVNYISYFTTGTRKYYMVTEGTKQFVVIDGVEQKKYDQVQYPSISDDEKYITYFAKEGNTWVLVVNGREVQP